MMKKKVKGEEGEVDVDFDTSLVNNVMMTADDDS